MPSKKSTKKTKRSRNISTSKSSDKTTRLYVATPEGVSGTIREVNKKFCKDGDDLGPYEVRRNPEPSPEEIEKKLAARKALTLRAFRIAYENHHRRKAS